jgi:exodeoxyribonuclease V alpha subunit
MHHRNLLYTAVTRAKESVILLGDRWGMENCASKRQVDRRNTFLSFLLHPVADSVAQALRQGPED